MNKRIFIIGGGAAGMACAITVKQNHPEYSVTILEKNDRIGKKILKTGNGRCNLSNRKMETSFYNDPVFLGICLSQFSVEDLLHFFKTLGLFVKDDGSTRLYPHSETATTVMEVLRQEISRFGIEVVCNCQVMEIKKNKTFILGTTQGLFEADVAVMTTGSLAQEATNGYQLLETLGHRIVSLRPGLVAIKTKESLKSLQGLRVKCAASVFEGKTLLHQDEGEILFKVDGLSGILSLDLSRYLNKDNRIVLDLFPGREDLFLEISEILTRKNLENALLGMLPKMLVYEILKRNPELNLGKIVHCLHNLEFSVIGTYGFDSAQITLGGADVSEINPDFSSKKVPGLYLAGEVLNIDGASGGYNLHFAWMSGILVGRAISGF